LLKAGKSWNNPGGRIGFPREELIENRFPNKGSKSIFSSLSSIVTKIGSISPKIFRP